MQSNHNALLEIITDTTTAMKVYPYVHSWRDEVIPNNFLRGMYVDFNQPKVGKTTISERNSAAPTMEWYVLFEDAEKEIQSDEFCFYGVAYETTVAKAVQRLKKFIDDLDSTFNTVKQKDLGRHRQLNAPHRRLWSRDKLKTLLDALLLFKDKDEIRLYFLYEDWPSEENATKTDYVKKFKSKILADWTNDLVEDPLYMLDRDLFNQIPS